MKPSLLTSTLLLLAASLAATPAGTSFTWQGTVTDGDALATGTCDLKVTVYAVESGGSPLAGPFLINDLAISNGRVSFDLDLGAVPDAAPRWLALEVRDGASTGAYTPLAPRRRLGATPETQHAAAADGADVADSVPTAGDADTLDGQHRAYYLAWSSLTGVPPDLADGDDDTLGDLSCAPGEIATWSGSTWVCDPDDHLDLARTVVVEQAGDPAANGSALLAALASLPTPSSADDGWLVHVEPGLFDLGEQSLAMKPWMVLEGSGQGATTVTSASCSLGVGPTIMVAAHGELRDLRVENTCNGVPWTLSAAVLDDGDGVRLTRVTAIANGDAPSCRGVSLDGADVVLERVVAWGGGAFAEWGAGIEMHGSNALLLDCVGEGTNIGLRLSHDGSQVRGGSFRATGGVVPGYAVVGMYLADSDLTVSDASVEGPANAIRVTSNDDDVVTLSRVTAQGNVRLWTLTNQSLTVLIEHSSIHSGTASTIDDTGFPNATVGVAATLLDGAGVSVGGGSTIACAGVWDENDVFYSGSCP